MSGVTDALAASLAAPLLGQGLYWNDMKPGQTFRTLRRTVTESDLVNFIGVTGMLEAIFIDAHYSDGAIEGRLVPAALTFGLIEGMQFQTLIQGTGLALLDITLSAKAPVRVDDTVWAGIEIASVKPTRQKNRAVVAFAVRIFNQDGLLVLSYHVTRMIAGRDADLPDTCFAPQQL